MPVEQWSDKAKLLDAMASLKRTHEAAAQANSAAQMRASVAAQKADATRARVKAMKAAFGGVTDNSAQNQQIAAAIGEDKSAQAELQQLSAEAVAAHSELDSAQLLLNRVKAQLERVNIGSMRPAADVLDITSANIDARAEQNNSAAQTAIAGSLYTGHKAQAASAGNYQMAAQAAKANTANLAADLDNY